MAGAICPGIPAPRAAPGTSRAPGRPPADLPDVAAGGDLTAVAWIVREVTHVPGVLRLRDDRLSFASTRGTVFDARVDELALQVGRTARAGMRVTVDAERLRLHVVRPPGGVAPCTELVDRLTGGAPSTEGDPTSWAPWRDRLVPRTAAGPRPARRATTRVRRALGVFSPSF